MGLIKGSNKILKLDDIESIVLNEAENKVLNWFFSYPDIHIGLNDLSSALSISKTTASKIIEELSKIGFIKKQVFGKSWIISCNKEHIYNSTKKVVFNLAMVYEAYQSGLREHILKIVGNAQAIILFGSYRKGDDTDKSDVDIAVEIINNDELKIIELGIIPIFGFRKDVRVTLHIFSRNKIDLNLFSNIANGIVLEGYLEVRP